MQCLTNHIYWSIAHSDGDGALATQRYLSINNHLHGIHSWRKVNTAYSLLILQ